jgi:hypothetical protein
VAVSGACLGLEVMLESDSLSFGPVCEGSQLVKHLHIYNGGDVGAQFRWDAAAFGAEFAVSPATGFLPPQSDTPVAITFKPSRLGADIRIDRVRCEIEGAPEPLRLTLTGDCVPRPAATGAPLAFACRVRESATQTVTLPRNDSDRVWTITPVISNEFWSGPLSVDVPPRSAATYTLTYKPLTMTRDAPADAGGASGLASARASARGAPATASTAALPAAPAPVDSSAAAAQIGLTQHTGSVFFGLPDGSGVMYALSGKAAAPAPGGNLALKTPAKKLLNFVIPVANWLRTTQRFMVTWEAKAIPQSAQLRGARTLDVPGLGTREYKMTYQATVEGKAATTVTFVSETTGEYVSYDVALEATPAGVAGSLALESVVRQTASATLVLANPLAAAGVPISFAPAVVDHPALRVVRVSEATGQPEVTFRVDYRPLVPTGPAGSAVAAAAPAATAAAATAADAGAAGGKKDGKVAAPAAGAKAAAGGAGKAGAAAAGAPIDAAAASAASASTARVTLHSDQLGDFIYEVALRASVGGAEPALRFAAPLGTKQAVVYRFRHLDARPGTYRCAVTRPDVFALPPSVAVAAPAAGDAAWDGVESSVEVVFEPTAVGEVAAELTLTSEVAGSYTVPLVASCVPPRPAGPYVLAPGGSASIDFRNVFNEDRDFLVSTDNPAVFAPTPAGAVRVPKKGSLALAVRYTPPAGGSAADVGGKLVVACPSLPEVPPWVFYLRGAADPAAAAAAGAAGPGGKARVPSASGAGGSAAPTPAKKK